MPPQKPSPSKTPRAGAPGGKPVGGKPVGGKPRTRRAKVMTLAQAGDFLRALAATNPAPETELHFRDAYTLLVAVALSAQTTDVAVNKATATLFEEAATPAAMVALGEEGVARHIRRIGLWQGKARNVVELSRLLIEQHGGEVPLNRADLQALPGVGRKTASVVLNELGIEAALAVDTHVFRVSHRLGLANAGTPDKVEAQLFRVVPEHWLPKAHHWLILHGRYACTARKPKCGGCVISDLCPSRAGLAALGEAG